MNGGDSQRKKGYAPGCKMSQSECRRFGTSFVRGVSYDSAVSSNSLSQLLEKNTYKDAEYVPHSCCVLDWIENGLQDVLTGARSAR